MSLFCGIAFCSIGLVGFAFVVVIVLGNFYPPFREWLRRWEP